MAWLKRALLNFVFDANTYDDEVFDAMDSLQPADTPAQNTWVKAVASSLGWTKQGPTS